MYRKTNVHAMHALGIGRLCNVSLRTLRIREVNYKDTGASFIIVQSMHVFNRATSTY